MISIENLNFEKLFGLIPAVIVDINTNIVLMLGFMDKKAFQKTVETGKVTFFSRTRQTLWTKGDSSGNFLSVVEMKSDCDYDTLLIKVKPEGNTCHLGDYSCFKEVPIKGISFLSDLFKLIELRKETMPENSYTTQLFRSGENRIIQKVGEEAMETVIAAKNRDKNEIVNETSDLLYHLFVMLVEQGVSLQDVVSTLEKRHHNK